MDLKQWAAAEESEGLEDDDLEGEVGAPEQSGADEDFTLMVRENRAAIEAAASRLSEEALADFDEELSEEDSGTVSDSLDDMPEEFTDALAEVDEKAIIAAVESVEEDLDQVSPGAFSAWLYRASKLS